MEAEWTQILLKQHIKVPETAFNTYKKNLNYLYPITYNFLSFSKKYIPNSKPQKNFFDFYELRKLQSITWALSYFIYLTSRT